MFHRIFLITGANVMILRQSIYGITDRINIELLTHLYCISAEWINFPYCDNLYVIYEDRSFRLFWYTCWNRVYYLYFFTISLQKLMI